MQSKAKVSIELTVQITLNESEARALDAMLGYGPEEYISGFYKQLGRAYLEPYAHAIPGLFKSVNDQIRPAIHRVDKARDEFNKH